jgi:hypothetical protein
MQLENVLGEPLTSSNLGSSATSEGRITTLVRPSVASGEGDG